MLFYVVFEVKERIELIEGLKFLVRFHVHLWALVCKLRWCKELPWIELVIPRHMIKIRRFLGNEIKPMVSTYLGY